MDVMGRLIGYLFLIAAGFVIGGLIGWLIGVAWYEWIEVPYAYRSMDMVARDGYLCGAGSTLAMLAVPGAILGTIFGVAVSTYLEIRMENDVPAESN